MLEDEWRQVGRKEGYVAGWKSEILIFHKS